MSNWWTLASGSDDSAPVEAREVEIELSEHDSIYPHDPEMNFPPRNSLAITPRSSVGSGVQHPPSRDSQNISPRISQTYSIDPLHDPSNISPRISQAYYNRDLPGFPTNRDSRIMSPREVQVMLNRVSLTPRPVSAVPSPGTYYHGILIPPRSPRVFSPRDSQSFTPRSHHSVSPSSRPQSRVLSTRSIGLLSNRSSGRFQIPDQLHLPHPISKHYPVFAMAMAFGICLSYVLGVLLSKELSIMQVGMSGPVSPPYERWWFYTITPFPECEDRRVEPWRLVSMQFAHNGLWHLGGNTICLLVFGSILEVYHPLSLLAAIVIFEVSLVSGVLGYSLLYPYTGIVGASPGVYGLIGACWYVAVAHRDLIDPLIAFVLPGILVTELACDILFYFAAYNSSTAYSSHAFGMVTGFLLAMSFTVTYRDYHWKTIVPSAFAVACLCIMLGYTVWHYVVFYPPQPYILSSLHNEDERGSCCSQLFDLMDEYPYKTKAQLSKSFICRSPY